MRNNPKFIFDAVPWLQYNQRNVSKSEAIEWKKYFQC